MGRLLRRFLITGVVVPGLFVGVVVAAAALPSTAGSSSESATSATPAVTQRVATSHRQPKTNGTSAVPNVALSSSFATASAKEKTKKSAKEGTRTAIISINPPTAQSSSTSVTIVASVTRKGMGPDPTGSVTFAYYTVGQANGGPMSGVLGVSPLSDGEAMYTTSAGQLPPGGPQNGSITITASYSGDHFNRASSASMIYFVTASCPATRWPAASSGYPHVTAKGAEGDYIGQSNGWFTLYVTHPGPPVVVFTGTIESTGLILDLSSTKDEGPRLRKAPRFEHPEVPTLRP